MAKKQMTFDVAQGIVTDTFLAEVNNGTDIDAIKAKVVDAERRLGIIIVNENDDAQLTAARELAKDLGKGYSEQRKTEAAKIVVCLNRLRELGDV